MASDTPVPAPTPADLARDLRADLRAIEAYRPDEWIPGARHGWGVAIVRALAAEARVNELQRSFDLRWKASQRAIDRWRAEDPAGRRLEQPDHTDMCCWLLDRLTAAEAKCEQSRQEYAELKTAVWHEAGSPDESFSDMTHSETIRQAQDQSLAFKHINMDIVAEYQRLRLGLSEAADRLLAWCDMPDADATMRAVSRYLRQLLKEGSTNG